MANSFTITTKDGAQLLGTYQGHGKPVLLISGLGGTATFWTGVSAALAADGYQVFCVNQRGINGSTRGSADLTIEQLAVDFLQVLEHFGVSSAHVVGHSTGGCIAQQIGLIAPERVRSLVLGATWAGSSAYMSALFAFRKQLLQENPQYYQKQGVYLSYPAQWIWEHPDLLQTSPWPNQAKVHIVQERIDALLAYEARSMLQSLKKPTLILSAQDDAVVPSQLQAELQQLIPQAKMHVFPVGGHFFPITLPHEYMSELTDWFSRVKYEN